MSKLNGDPVKICLFMPNLGGGGAERVMVFLANAFVARGQQVDLVLLCNQGAYSNLVDTRVRIVELATRRVAASLIPLAIYLKRNRPGVLLTTIYYASVVALMAAMLSNVSTRVFVRIESTLSMLFSSKRSVKGRILVLLVKRLFPRADGIIAVSKGVAQDALGLLRIDATKVHTIYSAAYPPDIDILSAEEIDDKWYAGERPLALAVGRLTKEKDFESLIRAFSFLKGNFDCRLAILGEGEERMRLESIARELKLGNHIRFEGFVSNPFKYMKRASVFVLSSRFEGLPGALLQAMRCGCPVVSTDCKYGPSEILENGRYGLLVPVGNSEKLAKAIEETLATPSDKTVLIDRANEFSIERAVDSYLQLFRASTAFTRE